MHPSVTMNRVVHAAVRRDLARLVSALDSAEDGDAARAKGLERAYANLRHELTHHHEGEDTWIWPMLGKVGVDPALLATMESEHQSMAAALAETSDAMAAFAASGSRAAASVARESVVRTQSVVDAHLTHEEAEVEPLVVPHVESPEWKEVERRLSRQPPSVAGPYFAWLCDGISDDDRTKLRQIVPAPVMFILGRVFGRRYNREIAPVWHAG